MKIDQIIAAMTVLKEKIGGDEEVPMMATFGDEGGEEFTEMGTQHYQ